LIPLLKLLRNVAAFLLVSACSTLPIGNKEPQADLSGAVQVAEMRTAELEVELARVKSDNARLASQVLDLQRENDKLASTGEDDASAEDDGLKLAGAALPPSSEIKLRDPDVSSAAIVEDAGTPELEEGDVPVAPAPRMVQPTFASTDAVFENEAAGDIETASVLFGVHLASYRKSAEAREGWRQLQRENPDELGLLEPRIESVQLQGKGVFLRLIGGGFSSEEKASALCASLQQKGLFCSVSGFNGQRLSLSETG